MGAEAPRFVLLDATEGLEGPRGPEGSGGVQAPAARAPYALTGGGLAVLVDPVRGLLGVWQGEERVTGPLTLRSGEAIPLGTPDGYPGSDAVLRLGPGSWERSFPLPEGGVLEERGLVPDVEGGIVMQWTLRQGPAAPTLTGSLALPNGTPLPLPPLPLEPGTPRTVALVPPGSDPEGARKRLAPLRARELERRGRGKPDNEMFTLDEEGSRSAHLPGALALLDDTALGLDEDGHPRAPFLAGVEGAGASGTPAFLRGTALAEVGLGALLTGRHDLARAALQALARDPDPPPPLQFLFLAARWALWSGRPGELLPLEGTLEATVEGLLQTIGAGPAEGIAESAPSGSAFPSPARTLEMLSEGLEPLGEARWGDGLRERIRQARDARGVSHGPDAPGASARLRLSVLGQPPEGDQATAEETPPTLPPPEAFGRPDVPGQRHASTLRAARVVRSWVEGVLGAEADAAYGRLTLAPRIGREVEHLAVTGLRIGDASISLDCRRQGPSCTFLLRQDRGRVPVNLIFAPRLPMAGVSEVRIGNEAGDVEMKKEPDGVVVRCQFPLDPERRITIVGRD